MNQRSEALHELLRRAKHLLGVPDAQTSLEVSRRIGLLNEREKTIGECSLLVALLGGTKVGKTTLVNALAGKVIGEASAIACFTSRPAVYVHKNREAVARARLAGVLQPSDKFEIHEEKGLEGIILVDTPDFDGVEAAHRNIFHRILERADLAICVVTTQKYDAGELFEILGHSMGFRRTVVVFNRTDEGIQLSEAIRGDFIKKFARFNLKPPEGETLPIFAVSALNALLRKTGRESGSVREFSELEKFLRERLDRALIKRINDENLKTLEAEINGFVREACRFEVTLKTSADLVKLTEDTIRALNAEVKEVSEAVLKSISGELIHRRAAAAAEGIGGPFGTYLRFSLALRGLARGIAFSLPTMASDPAENMAQRLFSSHETIFLAARNRLKQRITEAADRAGFDAGNLTARLDETFSQTHASEHMASELRKKLGEPTASAVEAVFLNVLPISLILLLIRYFIVSLLEAREPGAGMFIGTGLMFWLICHLQSSIWLSTKAGSGEQILGVIHTAFMAETRERFLSPVNAWSGDVQRLAQPKPDEKT